MKKNINNKKIERGNRCPLCKDGVLLLDHISMVKNYYRCTKCNKVFTLEVVFTFVEDSYDEETE